MKKGETSEKVFERSLSKYVNDRGGLALKLSATHFKGIPDRVFLIPYGSVMFVEFKSTGKKPTAIQNFVHELLGKIGFPVYVVDSVGSYDRVINKINSIALWTD